MLFFRCMKTQILNLRFAMRLQERPRAEGAPVLFPPKERNKNGGELGALRCDSLPFGASQKFLGFQRGFLKKSPLAAGGSKRECVSALPSALGTVKFR